MRFFFILAMLMALPPFRRRAGEGAGALAPKRRASHYAMITAPATATRRRPSPRTRALAALAGAADARLGAADARVGVADGNGLTLAPARNPLSIFAAAKFLASEMRDEVPLNF